MDKKARDIIGLPVITFDRGVKVADVHDLIIDPEMRQVLALVMDEKAMFHSARAIPFGRISAIGSDAVIIPDGKAVIDVDRDKVLKRLYNNQTVRGLRVLTDDGRKLGEVSDMLIDDKTGEIKGYHVSIGRMLSMGQGTKWLPADSVLNMGQRVMYVPASVADDFEAQPGGIAGALDQAGGKLRVAGAKANTRLEELGEQAKVSGSKLNEQLGQLGEQVREAVPQRTAQMVVGKTAHKTVTAPDDTVIVSEGDTITQDNVDAAKQTGRLPQLVMSAGVGPAQQGAGNLGGQATQSLSDMRTEARDLWGQITNRYEQVVGQTDDKMMERRIKHALGRPATRVILDGDDNIILNTGDIITNRAIDAARQAGVLDVLVDSVYTERPKLTLEDLKAPRTGEASLESELASGASTQETTSSQATKG